MPSPGLGAMGQWWAKKSQSLCKEVCTQDKHGSKGKKSTWQTGWKQSSKDSIFEWLKNINTY